MFLFMCFDKYIKQKKQKMIHNADLQPDSVQNKYLDRDPSLPNNPQREVPPENNEQDIKQKQGVSGRYHWPIRIVSFLIFVGTVVGNYIGGLQTILISNKYSLYVTPPSLFFIIWAVIFSFMGLVQIYNLIKNKFKIEVLGFLAANNILLVIWVNVFGIGTEVAVYICFPILIGMVVSTAFAWVELGKAKKICFFIYAARNVYAFYEGWIIASLNLNLGVLIKYWWKASDGVQMIVFWILVLTFSYMGMLGAYVKQRKKGLKSYLGLWVSIIWAVVGAAIRSVECVNDPSLC